MTEYSHNFECICESCSERRREFWRRGEPEIYLTASQYFSVSAIMMVLAAAVFFGAVWILSGCQPIIRQPSCGEPHTRSIDGAVCRECLDSSGSYALCGARVWEKK